MNVVTTFFRVQRIPGSVLLSNDENLSQRYIREKEYLECIRRNAECPAVSRVHLLVQDTNSMNLLLTNVFTDPSFQHLRGKIVPTLAGCNPNQPLYSDLFRYCNNMLRGALCMVANADIYLPHNFRIGDVNDLLKPRSDPPKRPVALALTRYESEGSYPCPLITDYRGSHDAFVFRSPILNPSAADTPASSFADSVSHKQNCYKAENIVVYELRRHGYAVLNPCLDVKIVHMHEADVRQWLPAADEERYAKAEPMTTEAALKFVNNVM